MSRVKPGKTTRRKHKKILKLAKGYRGSRSRRYKCANEAVIHALTYAYRDRRAKKRDMRRLWITRINAGARINGLSYNKFMFGLKKAGININRKVLADLAITDSIAFSKLAETASKGLNN
jgi:large subunit ribosomal protein L20